MIVETNKNTSTGKYEVDIKTNGVVAELEANKEVSIDVSNYSEPVEITPSGGKNGMEKATITLTNISSGGAVAYGWVTTDGIVQYLPVSVAPANVDEFLEKCAVAGGKADNAGTFSIASFAPSYSNYTKVSDTEFSGTAWGLQQTFTRDSSKDFTLWETN